MRFIIFGLLFLSAVYFSESYSIAKRDTKDDLLKSAENLRVLAQKEIEKLKGEGKVLLAAGLQRVDKLVVDLESQLKNLNPTTEVGKALLVTLEAALKRAETDLEAEIKKLSGSYYDETLKDELLKQAENLKKLAADEIAKLKAQGKTLLATGLEKAEKFVLDLETQLKNLNPTTEVGKVLLASVEALLKKAETALEDEIKKLSASLVKRDTKDDLLKSAENLRVLAQKEIEKLKGEGKVLLAAGLQRVDKLVVDLEAQLKNLNPTTEVGKALLVTLEAALKRAETDLEAEIKKLSGSYYDETLKDELLKQAENLKKLAADEIAKLKAQGKTVLAAGLEKAEKFVLDLETQLKNLNPTTEVGKALLASVEALLKKAETTLEDEIKKLSASLVKRDAQADLLKTITELLTKAHNAVETLQKEGKPALVAGLQKSIKFLTDVEAQLKNLHPTTELGKALLEGLEQLVKQGEAALEEDLKKANAGFAKRDTKDDLLKSAENLRVLAQKEIEKLKGEGKVLLAAGLQRVDKLVVDLEAQLKNLNPTTEVGKALLVTLEAALKRAETDLEAEIKKLSGSYYDETLKDELLKQAENLKKLAADEIAKLKAQGKTLLATGLENAEKFVLDLETQLKNLNPTTELGKVLLASVEALLKKAETTLEDEIKKLSGSYYDESLKDELLKQAENLKKLAADEIAKLKAQGKTLLATGLENAEKFVLDLETQLKNLNPTTELGKVLLASVEALLKKAETTLEDEIKKLSASLVKRDAQADLLKTITELLTKAHNAVETLQKEGKPALVAGLQKSIKFLTDVEAQLKNLHPTTELGKALLEGLEQLVKQGEAALEEDLKKANASF